MKSPRIPAFTIRLAAHEHQISLAEIGRQIYDNLRDLGRALSGDAWSCFPFCSDNRSPDWHRPWPRMRDFRDSFVTGLPQVPPTDGHECETIKLDLLADLNRQRQMFGAGAMELVGTALMKANQVVDEFERDLTAKPSRPLTKVDMHYHANVVIRSRIQKFLDAEVTDGRLLVIEVADERVVTLRSLVTWAFPHGIMVEQDALPGCTSALAHSTYHYLYQRHLDEQVRDQSDAFMKPPSAKTQEQGMAHKLQSRTLPLQAEIERAMDEALNRDDASSVWNALVMLADQQVGPLIGLSSAGIKYYGKGYQATGEHDVFTKKNLRDRMDRARRRATTREDS